MPPIPDTTEPDPVDGLHALQARLDYRFASPGLLLQALTHRSFSALHNERLEFLGDAVLGLVVAHLLFAAPGDRAEGDLSRMRANLVREESLHRVALALDLPPVLRLGAGEQRSGGRERPSILADALEAAGIARGDYIVRVNDRRVLNGVLAATGVGDPGMAADVLRTIDKFDKVGADGVRELLTTGCKDASGAFIDGVGLRADQAEPVLGFLTSRGADNTQTLANLRAAVGTDNEGVTALEAIAAQLAAMGVGPDRVIIDPSVVRGLGYYTGPVFEAELTFEILDDKGRRRQFGSVAGGGRYDDLVERFTGQKVPATGVSIGVDRLLAALAAKGTGDTDTRGPVTVTVMDRDRMGDYMAMAASLRAAGIRAEVYLGNPRNFGNQLKYADKRGAPVAIIQGSDEAARGVVQVKDLILGARLAEDASHEEWKAQPAQVEIPLADLVATDATPETLVYAAQFLSGLGRTAGEPVLAKAALDLEADKDADVITRVRALVEQRAKNGLPA